MRSGFRLPDLSLRARLLIALVVLAAVGLAALDFVSYRALHSYLYDRVDQQVEAAVAPVSLALGRKVLPGDLRALGGPRVGAAGAGAGGAGAGAGTGVGGPRAGAKPPPPGDLDGGGPGPGPAAQLPPGTYGQLRRADGKVLARVLFAYGESGVSLPALPAQIDPSPRGQAELFTVGERGGGGERFRAVAVHGPGRTVTVVAIPLGDTQATLDRLALIELVVSAVTLVALALLAWWLVGVGLRPLRRMEAVAGDIAAGDLSRRVEPANAKTEVGRLGLALNAMLTQIEGAFAEREAGERRLRRFLADASHELRTPLAAIRGYSELHRIGANREPGQVDRAMSRIESESERMGVLVDDLLTLARIDEVREPVRERFRLDELLGEAREDAAASAPERRITLEAGGAVEIDADAGQVRRVFDNLLRNAITHTPERTPIELSLSTEGGEALARVRDHGPGLPPGDPEALFERFWRNSASRGREDGGAGLGLAIVAAIVNSHGGSVEAVDRGDGGAEFTVRLPLAS